MSSSHKPHDDQSQDQAFFRTFGMVLAALGGIFAFCIFAASLIVPKAPVSAGDLARIESRIKPVASEFTDPAALLLASAPAIKHVTLTGDQLVAQVCSACHVAGVLGAPKIGDKGEWAKRKAAYGSVDGLVASAIKGKNQMPARGGNPDLSDDEIKAAVSLMLSKSGV